MTPAAIDTHMDSVEREGRVSIMIKAQPLPGLERVATGADRQVFTPIELPGMRIFMAGYTVLRKTVELESHRLFTRLIDPVAIEASGLLIVPTDETVVGALVVEIDPTPAFDIVTSQTVSLQHETSHRIFVGIPMTGRTQGRREGVLIEDVPPEIS